MSTIEALTNRATFIALGTQALGGSHEWDRAVRKYLRADALQHADSQVGAYAKVTEEATRDRIVLQGQYKSRKISNVDHGAALDRISTIEEEASTRWTADYLEPYWAAARELALTPAPTFVAALFKEQVMFREDLANDTEFGSDCMAILRSDFERLSKEPV